MRLGQQAAASQGGLWGNSGPGGLSHLCPLLSPEGQSWGASFTVSCGSALETISAPVSLEIYK